MLPWLACNLSGTLQSPQFTSPQEGNDYSHGFHLAFFVASELRLFDLHATSLSTDISLRLVLHLPPLLLIENGYKVKAPYFKPQYYNFVIHPLFTWKNSLQHEEVLFITIAITKGKWFLSGFGRSSLASWFLLFGRALFAACTHGSHFWSQLSASAVSCSARTTVIPFFINCDFPQNCYFLKGHNLYSFLNLFPQTILLTFCFKVV